MTISPEFFYLLLANALYIIGFYLSCDEGMIFERIQKLEQPLGVLYKPLAGCVTCMASLHSWPFFFCFDFGLVYLVYVFALAALNTCIYNGLFKN